VKIDHQAASFLFSKLHGALCTVDEAGDPFASAVNLVPDGDGRLLMLVSELAVHTAHLKADSRASVLVFAGGEDWQASPRLSLRGKVENLDAQEGERYLALFPEAREYLEMDFSFRGVLVDDARWIAGFGEAGWLDAAALGLVAPWSGDREQEMVAHMNDDHADALHHYARQLGRQPETVTMVALDPWGAWLLADGERLRLAFAETARTAGRVREQLVSLTQAPASS
jgi:putative heme iron utilization protein